MGTDSGHSALLPVGIKTPFLFDCTSFWAGGGSKILSFPFQVCADNSSDLQPVVLAGCCGGNLLLQETHPPPQAKSLALGCGVPV